MSYESSADVILSLSSSLQRQENKLSTLQKDRDKYSGILRRITSECYSLDIVSSSRKQAQICVGIYRRYDGDFSIAENAVDIHNTIIAYYASEIEKLDEEIASTKKEIVTLFNNAYPLVNPPVAPLGVENEQ